MKLDRRSFIKLMAMNSAATAAATLFPGISFGAWKATDAPSGMKIFEHPPGEFVYYCRIASGALCCD